VIITLKKFPYRYLPYEERLLIEEAGSLGDVVSREERSVQVRAEGAAGTTESLIQRLHRLTYFSHFSVGNGAQLPTQQFLFETTANGSRTAARQSTRYSTHGFHEYKGKFHPQIARYLMSQTGLAMDSVVFDPFAGSGTVLVEALHFGCNAIGVEANPLAVLVANSKLKLLSSPERELKSFKCVVDDSIQNLSSAKGPDAYATALKLSEAHREYLHSWFAPRVLGKLLKFRFDCRKELSSSWACAADVLLSSIAREVSHQDPADLRIRRRKKPLQDAPVEELLAENASTVTNRALGARNLLGHRSAVTEVFLGDSRNSSRDVQRRLLAIGRCRIDAVITSPPYATAMPYVDTSRLSLVLLGLCDPSELKSLERLQIGNREISPSERKKAEESIEERLAELPKAVRTFVRKLVISLTSSDAGFRKRNMPALLTQYFTDMKEVLAQNYKLIEPGGLAFWLVGPNKTQLNHEWLQIDTPLWLADVAESVGFSASMSPLNAYQRFGLHQRNGIREEFLLTLLRN
jgi:site-specific DNA-methyltransferase (cytosine-N4-specific)